MKRIIIILTALLLSMATFAQQPADSTAIAATEFTEKREKRSFWNSTWAILKSAAVGVEYRVKAGIAIGGTLPMPIPLEIREIKGFNPLLNLSIEGEVMKEFTDDWALSFGLRFEQKGMSTDARVKSYQMEIMLEESGTVEGVWTGSVNTRLQASYLTLPVLAVWRMSPRWGLKLGLYGSYMTSGRFTATAYDGYLRVGDPTGARVSVEEVPPTDLSSGLRRWHYGVQLGAEWRAFSHLIVGLDATCGLNSAFKNDFKAIAFDMYPVYANLNFGYAF